MKKYNKVMVCMSFLLAGALAGCPQKELGDTSAVTSVMAFNESSQSDQSAEQNKF